MKSNTFKRWLVMLVLALPVGAWAQTREVPEVPCLAYASTSSSHMQKVLEDLFESDEVNDIAAEYGIFPVDDIAGMAIKGAYKNVEVQVFLRRGLTIVYKTSQMCETPGIQIDSREILRLKPVKYLEVVREK